MGRIKTIVAAFLVVLAGGSCQHHAQQETLTKLYKISCGHLAYENLARFSTNGEYDSRAGEMPVNCYLVRHADGDLLWDTGLPDEIFNAPRHQININGALVTVEKTLESGLADLGLTPDNIDYVALSHSHPDHIGNLGLFRSATVVLQIDELEYALNHASSMNGIVAALNKPLRSMKRKTFRDNVDVFGDGAVVIQHMPGHTPGHSVLQLRLKNTGPLLLSGDLFHYRESRKRKIVPSYNYNYEMTMKSMSEFDALAASIDAEIIVQHDSSDNARMPTPPEFLD